MDGQTPFDISALKGILQMKKNLFVGLILTVLVLLAKYYIKFAFLISSQGNTKLSEILVRNGVNPNMVTTDFTRLHFAVLDGIWWIAVFF